MTQQLRQPIIFLGVVLLAHTAAFIPVWKSLVAAWSNSDDYSHAFFIAPLSLYLIWSKKEEIAGVKVTPTWNGVVIVLFASIIYILGTYAGVFTLNGIALVISLLGAVLAVLGIKIAKVIWFPLIFLFLMIPIPSQIYWAATTPLQLIVTDISVIVLRFITDIPIFRDGNVISLPEKTLQVVAACSGMRSIISLTTISLLFGYLSLRSVVSMVALTLSAIPIAIIINILRIFVMVTADYYLHFDLSSGAPHTYLGVAVFGVAIVLTFLCQKLLAGVER